MHSKILIIYEYKNLFEILNEISESLNFKILYCDKKEYDQIKFDTNINYLTISKKKIDGINNLLILGNLPLKFEKILEIININFLKNRFINQSYIKIGKYNLNLNSRKISFKDKNLDLTERETNLIIFMNEKKNVTVKELQKNRGSAIFLHLTKDYSATKGCVAIKKKDFLILNKLISKKTKIKIT